MFKERRARKLIESMKLPMADLANFGIRLLVKDIKKEMETEEVNREVILEKLEALEQLINAQERVLEHEC